MGGKGVRLKEIDSHPKPLILVDGIPMVKRVIDSLGFVSCISQFTYVVRTEHRSLFEKANVVHSFPFGTLFEMREDNRGQTETCLLAQGVINNDEPLFIVNCDNVFDWNPEVFLEEMKDPDITGSILTFKEKTETTHWCFAEVDLFGEVRRLEEKIPISRDALAGGFYWKKGSDFVKYARRSIAKNKRAKNGEFYLGAVYNEPIGEGKTIKTFNIAGMQSLGTPKELEEFKV